MSTELKPVVKEVCFLRILIWFLLSRPFTNFKIPVQVSLSVDANSMPACRTSVHVNQSKTHLVGAKIPADLRHHHIAATSATPPLQNSTS